MRRSFHLIILVLLVAAAGSACERDRPPNLIVIFADDLGYGDLGAYGHPTIRTPSLDRMAAEGMKLTQFYASASACTPSRAGLLTGRLAVRSGMASTRFRVLFPNSAGGLPDEELTIAEVLGARGYATSIIGKWHLGHRPEFLPARHGFDYFFGLPYSNDMHLERRGDPPVPLMRDGEVIEQPVDQTTLTRRYTEEAIAFVRANRDRPFFLYLAHTFPHIPLFVSDAFSGTSSRGLYGDVVEELDWSTGEILSAVREAGLASNTLVIFTSDNGPWLTKREEGGSAGLLRDGKGATWEGGLRVPAIAWWPETIPAGVVSQALSSTLDLLPTALDLVGEQVPSDRILDGYSLWPVLSGARAEPRKVFFYYRGDRLFAIRKGPWKAHLITQSGYGGEPPEAHDPPILYHLERDPSEQFDVSADHPEVIADLLDEVARHLETIASVPSQLEVFSTP